MKKLLIGLAALLVAGGAYGAFKGAPFEPEIDARFNELDGLKSQSFQFNVPSAGLAQGTYKIGSLPGASIYTNGYLSFPEQFAVSGGTINIAIGCETASNIRVATNVNTGVGGSIIILPRTVGPLVGSNLAPCDINLVVAGTASQTLTAGKLRLMLQYLSNQ